MISIGRYGKKVSFDRKALDYRNLRFQSAFALFPPGLPLLFCLQCNIKDVFQSELCPKFHSRLYLHSAGACQIALMYINGKNAMAVLDIDEFERHTCGALHSIFVAAVNHRIDIFHLGFSRMKPLPLMFEGQGS